MAEAVLPEVTVVQGSGVGSIPNFVSPGAAAAIGKALGSGGVGNIAGAGLGGPANNGVPAQPAQQQCAQGGPGGGPGSGIGQPNNGGLGNGLNPALADAFNCAKPKWEAANPGMKVYGFSGRGSRPIASSKHPSGNALDVAIYGSDGGLFNNLRVGAVPAFRAYESFAETMGSCDTTGSMKWGGNFNSGVPNDAMHFQLGGSVARGDVYKGIANPTAGAFSSPQSPGSEGFGKYNGPTDAAKANSGAGAGSGIGQQNDNGVTGQGNNQQAPCTNQGQGNGCQPITAAAAPAASAISQGQGMGAASGLLQGLGGMAQNPMALAQGLMQSAAGAAAGLLGGGGGGGGLPGMPGGLEGILGAVGKTGGIAALANGGLQNPLGNLTQAAFSQIQNLGSNILPSLTGVMPQSLLKMDGAGSLQGMMTGLIQKSASDVIKKGVPQLGGFPQIFVSALGSAASGANLKNSLRASASQIFGNAVVDGKLSNLSALPGFNIPLPSNATSEDIESYSDKFSFYDARWKPASEKIVDLKKPFAETLNTLSEKPEINAFGTLFRDYDAFATQGISGLTRDTTALGVDLINLGKLGDLKDLLNIGTAHQLARQLIENGFGISSGLLLMLKEKGLDPISMHDEKNSQVLFDILESINDTEIISNVKKYFEIDDRLNITNLSDLLKSEKIFVYSKNVNEFKDLRDMALTLAMCGGTGTMRTYRDLGLAIASLEFPAVFADAKKEVTALRPDEYFYMSEILPTESKFNEYGPVIADFIGSAAGYVHDYTLPKMNVLLEKLYNDPITDNLIDLYERLSAVLNGVHTGPSSITVPATGGYTFGTYSRLDDASLAVAQAIEAELTKIKTTANEEQTKTISELEGLHFTSAEFLAHEAMMRKKYGIELGEPRRTNNYYGDGSTLAFPLEGSLSSNHLVYVSGVFQVAQNNWNYNDSKNEIIFTMPPAANSIITIVYDVPSLKPEPRATDSWMLVSQLENLALETGYGGPADYLRRITTDDVYGQRINLLMMQARNREKLGNLGINCPGFNRILDDNGEAQTINFMDYTGLWTNDPSRASEIWLQNTQEVGSRDQYIIQNLNKNKENVQRDIDLLSQNIIRRMIFFWQNDIVISDQFSDIYVQNSNNSIYNEFKPDLIVGYNTSLPLEGNILGPYREIISELMRIENLSAPEFQTPLSNDVIEYHRKLNLSLRMVITILQRMLLLNGSSYLGINEDDFRTIFGIQSVCNILLKNIAEDY